MAQLDVLINFNTNAKMVSGQIKALNTQIAASQAGVARLNQALNTGKASSKMLTGDIRGRQAILKLDKQINQLAKDRVTSMTRGYHFGDQDRFIKNMLKQNEVMRIQRKIMTDNANAMVNMGKNTQWAGRQLVVGFTVPLTIAAGLAMRAFSDLERQLVKFKRVYGDISTSTEQTNAMAESVKNLATEWTKYGVAVSDTIGLAAEAAGAGFKGQQLMSQVETATKLSVLGQLEMQKAMASTIALQSTFKMSNQELGKSINFLNQLENQTMVTMDDMTTAIPKAATVVEGLGGSVQDLGVMMAALREGGVTAAEGANALKSGLGSLLNPSKAAKEALEKVGVALPDLWKESEENGKGVIFVVEQLADALDKLGQTQKQRLIEELFGKHQFARMNALLSNINKGTQALEAKKVAGTSGLEAALISQKELGKLAESSLTKFQASFAKLKASIAPLGKTIMDFVTPVVEGITKVINWFNKLPDVVKHVAAGFTLLIGIAAPLFLMLIGQVQNLLGNGLKLIAWMKGWGKNTQWVAQENLSLVASLEQIDAHLIAENKTLQKNIALWEQRRIAAGAAGRPFNEPRPTPRGRFATGGTVGGSGNRDTVPALLTPGEFVVNAKAAKANSNVLAAMNAGTLQGFQVGGRVATLMRNRQRRNAAAAVTAEQKAAQTLNPRAVVAQDTLEGLTPQQAKMVKQSSYAKLMEFKAKENVYVKRIYANILKKYEGLPFASVANWLQWDQSHIGSADSNKIINTKTGAKEKLWNYKGDLILDNHMININVPSVQAHPSTVPEVIPLKTLIQSKLKGNAINPNHLITNKLLDWRKSGGGKAFYDQYIDENFIFMNLVGGKKGARNTVKSGFGKGFKVNAGKEIKGVLYANSGFVPGSGNKDTVPAMLTPGETVVNKSASKKFSGILSAMNAGKVRMFARAGRVDSGAEKGWAAGEGPFPKQKIQDDMKRWADAADEIANDYIAMARMSETMKTLTEKQEKKLREDLKREYTKPKAAQVAHIIPEFDPATGKKIYRPSNAVVTPQLENNAMRQLSSSQQNMKALEKAAAKLAKATLIESATTEQVAAQKEKYLAVLQRMQAGEHIIDSAQRSMAGEMVATAAAAGKLTASMQANAHAIAAGLMGRNTITLAGHMGTQAVADAERAAILARGNVTQPPGGGGNRPPNGPGNRPPTNPDNPEDRARRRGGGQMGNNLMNIGFMISMFAGQLTGATDKLGMFSKALMYALPALMMIGMVPAGGGARGIIGRGGTTGPIGAAGGRFSRFGSSIGSAAGRIGGAVGGKYGKYGMGAGMIYGAAGAIGGGLLGSAISDEQGGARDVAGKAVSWGATGAGLGMMFGPWGAAIGAATGALAGFTVQILANNKAQKKAVEEAQKTGVAWSKIADELQAKFQIGGNQSIGDLAGDIDVTLANGNKELVDMLNEQLGDPNTEWSKRIASIGDQIKKGTFLGLQNELNVLAMELRGAGVEEKDIETIANAFAEKVNQTTGGAAGTAKLLTTDQIIESVTRMANMSIKDSQYLINRLIEESAAILKRGGGLGHVLPEDQQLYLDIQKTIAYYEDLITKSAEQFGIQVTSAIDNLTTLVMNTRPGSPENDKYLSQLDALYAASKKAQDSLQHTLDTATDQYGKDRAQSNLDTFRGATYKPVQDYMTSEEGIKAGYGEEAWKKWLDAANQSGLSAAELSQAATLLMKAGINISNMSIANQQTMAKVMSIQVATQAQANQLTADIKQGKQDLQTLDEFQAAGKNLDKANKDYGRQSLEAKLTVARIDIEKGALDKFVGKFNKAFGTSIDSFADAQYQIDKIGNKIQSIQLKVIAPIQEKADDLSRLNELDQRKISEIEDKRQEQIDKQNDSLEKQAEILSRIRAEQEFINNQQQTSVDMASALAQGNVSEAVKFMLQSNQQVSQYSASLQDQALQQQGGAGGLSPEEDARVKELEAKIKEREKKIQEYEDQIYNINENQIEPLQRKSDLMSLMLNTTKTEMEYRKANALGLDEENRQRDLARDTAWDSANAAKDELAAQQKIYDELKGKVGKIEEYYDTEGKGIEDTRKAIETKNAENQTALDTANASIKTMEQDIKNMQAGMQGTFDKWNEVLPPGGLGFTIAQAMAYIESGKVPTYEQWKADNTGPRGRTYTNAQGEKVPDENPANNRAAGGTIEGSGGQDSVPAMLTPGEFVMRKSAVNRIGVEELRRMNQGPTKRDGLYRGGRIRFAAGGKVPFFDAIADPLLEKISKEPIMQSAITGTTAAAPWAMGTGPAYYVPSGPIPGLSATEPGPSGMSAEGASWIKPSAVRMMRYVKQAFPWATGTTYMSGGEHGSGKAVDYWPSKPYKGAGNAQGWQLAQWAKKWKGPLGVRGVIFDDHVSGYGSWDQWRPYQHSSGSRSDTDRHLNHVHILNYKNGGLVPGAGNADTMHSMLTPGEFVMNRSAVNNIGVGSLRQLNSGIAPQDFSQQSDSEAAVYNYDMTINISEASDAHEVARVIMGEVQRMNNSKVRIK